MVEKITDKFEKAMKKGFVNLFVLLVLDKEPSHGYQLKKLIVKRTGGFWAPSDSTMYTILKDLRDKNLIEAREPHDPDDSRKIYELTEKGKKALITMREKEIEMRESMKSILFASTDISDKFFDRTIQDFILSTNSFEKSFDSPGHPGPLGPPMGAFGFGEKFIDRMADLTIEEQLDHLNRRRPFIKNQIERLTQILKNIDNQISELESK